MKTELPKVKLNFDDSALPRAGSVWQSFGYATEGILYVFRTQRNAKVHLGIASGVIFLGLLLDIEILQWAILFVMIGLVLAAEMLNTVVEVIVDLISPEYHGLAKIAKDVAAGAVFLLAMIGVVVGILVLGPSLLQTLIDLLVA